MAAICQGVLKSINTRTRTREGNSTTEEMQEPASPATRLFHAPGLNFIIIAPFGFKTKINVEMFKYGLTQTLIKHRRFSSKLVFDAKDTTKAAGWVRTKVNVDDHTVVPDFDPNIDSADELVEDYISNLTKIPMDLSKPLWELHVLNVKTSKAASVGVFRMHHSLGDGVSLMSVVLACTRKSSDPSAFPSLPSGKKKEKNFQTNNYPGFIKFFLALLFFLKVLWNTVKDIAQFMATTVYLKDIHNLVKDGPRPEQASRRFVYKMFRFDDIKLIKETMGVTINDVVLGITQAGLCSYLNKKYGKDKGANSAQDNYLPKHIRLRAALIMNLRPNTMIEGLAKMMEAEDKGGHEWGNNIGYVLLPFHIALKDDPLDYIRNAKATIDKKKQSFEAQLSSSMIKLLTNIFGLKAIIALTYKAFSHTTLCFSNLAGPTEEISFYGHPIAFIAPSTYGIPQGFMVTFQSYMDKMTLVLVVDEDIISDPHNLCDEIEASLILAKKYVISENVNEV